MTIEQENELKNSLSECSREKLIELFIKIKKINMKMAEECAKYETFYYEHVSLDEIIEQSIN